MSIDLLNQDDIDNIREDVKSVLEDNEFNVKIIYRRLVNRVFNPSTGTTTPTYEDTSLKAFMGNHSAREVGSSGGILQVGDEFFMFDPALLDAFPKPDDRVLRMITDEGYVKMTPASTTVLAYNTKLLQNGVQGGDTIVVDGVTVPINSVSAGGLVLKSVWSGSSIPAAQFQIYRVYEVIMRIIDPLRAACRMSVRRAGA